MKYLSFITGGEAFAVDVNLVRKIARNISFTPISAAPEAVLGIANIKGRVITVLDFTALLRATKREKVSNKISALILRADVSESDSADDLGFIIEAPGDLIEIEDEKISELPADDSENKRLKTFVSGVAEIENKLYRIIDVRAVVNQFETEN